jgi:hypothetical protein
VPEPLNCSLVVTTPVGDLVVCNYVLRGCPMRIQGKLLSADLIVFEMNGFDAILGMDWLSQYHACMNCFKKEVVFKPLNEAEFHFYGTHGTPFQS